MEQAFSFPLEKIRLLNAIYVDLQYAQNHAHTLHQHSEKLELLYVYQGNGRYRVGRRDYAVQEGDMLICNAKTLHGETLAIGNSIQTYCCAIAGLQLPGLPENCLLAPEKRQAISLTRYRSLIHEMMPDIYHMLHTQENSFQLAEQMAKTVLLMVCDELRLQQAEGKNLRSQKTEELVRSITDYLDRHYTEPELRMEDICLSLHISESHLFHAFKRETGLSPKQYIILRRIGEAQTLLELTDMPIHKIEEALGFGSSCHLTATFKKYVNISPREYRKHYRKGVPVTPAVED